MNYHLKGYDISRRKLIKFATFGVLAKWCEPDLYGNYIRRDREKDALKNFGRLYLNPADSGALSAFVDRTPQRQNRRGNSFHQQFDSAMRYTDSFPEVETRRDSTFAVPGLPSAASEGRPDLAHAYNSAEIEEVLNQGNPYVFKPDAGHTFREPIPDAERYAPNMFAQERFADIVWNNLLVRMYPDIQFGWVHLDYTRPFYSFLEPLIGFGWHTVYPNGSAIGRMTMFHA